MRREEEFFFYKEGNREGKRERGLYLIKLISFWFIKFLNDIINLTWMGECPCIPIFKVVSCLSRPAETKKIKGLWVKNNVGLRKKS